MQSSIASSSKGAFPERHGLMEAPSSALSSGDVPQQSGVSSVTQLPTPQTRSPSNLIPYFPGVAGSPESPLAYAHTRGLGSLQTTSLAPRMQSRSASPLHGHRRSPSRPPQTVTPETSPASSSKRPASPTFLARRPSSAPLLSTKGPFNMKAESPPPAPLGPAHIISPPVSVYSKSRSPEPSTTRSNLSSPFVVKLQLPDEGTKHTSERRQQQPAELLTPQPKPSLANATNLFSPVLIAQKRPASTQSDVPTPPPLMALPGVAAGETEDERQPGGELDRIKAHASMLRQERETDLESRRPGFFKRLKRSANDPFATSEAEASSGGLGILTSPVKGRRIQLFDAFRQTSEQSFEESLMTNGYGMYGEPKTPQRQTNSNEGPSKIAMKWLEHSSPAGPSTFPHFDTDLKLDEKEMKKRRLLEAFTGSYRTYSKLYPAEVEGIGRILVPPEDVEALLNSTPVKKRASNKKKKGVLASPVNIDKKGKGLVRRPEEFDEPKWLDNEFPWALRGKEREEEQRAFTAEKMRWIERYFSRDSDSDESDGDPHDEELFPSSTWGQEYEDPPVATRRGRGKAVPLQPNPARARSPPTRDNTSPLSTRKSKNMFFQTDPADARAALMSKRSVRMFTQRRARRNSSWKDTRTSSDEGQFACACGLNGHGDDGKPAVQCNQCRFWYHFDCIGIKDEKELGDEDDTWFCSEACREAYIVANAPEPDLRSPRIMRQPTFVPTDERPPPSLARGDVAFYSSSPQRPWGSSSVFETPLRSDPYRGREGDTFRRSIWDDVSLQTPAGPSSPLPGARNVRVNTPGGARYDSFGIGHDDMGFGSFDPMSTPSRGLKYTPGLFATPKQPSFNASQGPSSSAGAMGSAGLPGPSWASRAGGMFATPTHRGRYSIPGSAGFSGFGLPVGTSEDGVGMGFGRAHPGLAMYAADDTPIRRAPLQREPPRSLLMSLHAPSPTQPDSPSPARPLASSSRVQESPQST